MGELNIRVAASLDDCTNEFDITINRTATTLTFGRYGAAWYEIGLRFQGITIPDGSVVTNAYIQFVSSDNQSGDTVYADIYGEQNNSALEFDGTVGDFTGRSLTTAKVDWDFTTDWTTGNTYDTPDLTTILQELVDDYSGLSSANIVLLLIYQASGVEAFRNPKSYNGGAGTAPLLHAEWVDKPTVDTDAVSDIIGTTATGNGEITATGGANATRRGVCWDTETAPTTGDSEAHEDGDFGVEVFDISMTGLSADTHYYVRAYATNSAGTSYGSEVEFDTLEADMEFVALATEDVVLTLTNETAYTPTTDYHPATKKYVDDNAGSFSGFDGEEVTEENNTVIGFDLGGI